MRTRSPLFLGILTLITSFGSGSGLGSASAQDNAYDAWAPFFDAVATVDWRNPSDDPEQLTPLLSPEDLDLISEYASDTVRPPTAAEQAALAKLQQLAPLLANATESTTFHIELDLDQGFDLLLPHLGLMRQGQRCMAALAHQAAVNGDGRTAFEWARRLTTASGQVSQDQTMIGSLVGCSMYSVADKQLSQLIDSGLLDQDIARDFFEETNWIDASEDPFGFLSALVSEREFMAAELSHISDGLLVGDDSRLQFLFDMSGASGEGAQDLDADEVMRQAGLIDDAFEDILEAAADPDRARGLARIEAIEAELMTGDAPMLIAALMPMTSHCMEARIRMETALSDRMRIMEAVATGRLNIESIRNGATLWDRLGGWFERLPSAAQVAGLKIFGVALDDERLTTLLDGSSGGPSDDLLGLEEDGTSNRLRREVLSSALEDPMATWLKAVEPESETMLTLAADATAVSFSDFPLGGTVQPRLRLRGEDLDRLRGAGRGLLIDATVRLGLARSIELGLEADESETNPAEDTESADAVESMRSMIELERQRATTELVASIALIQDLISDPAIAHLILACDLLQSLQRVLESDDAAPVLADPIRRDLIAAGLEAIPRKPALGVREAVDADLQLWVDQAFNGPEHEEARDAVLRTLDNRGPNRIHALLSRYAGQTLKRIGSVVPAPITKLDPSEDEPAYELPAGMYRPLKLIASSEGVHGPDWLVMDTSATDDLVKETLRGIRANPRDTRRGLAKLENPDPYPLADTAGQADARLADIDGLLRERRRTAP